jgi:hypothetical protein
MISRQLELRLENRPAFQAQSRLRGRRGRAHWWFERMRGLVDEARDWEPAALPGESQGTSRIPAEPVEARLASKAPRWKFVRIRSVEGE